MLCNIFRCLINACILSALLLGASSALAEGVKPAPKKWRVIYVEGGQYIDFSTVFLEMLNELYRKKIITKPVPQHLSVKPNSRKIWQWLVRNANNDSLEFLVDGFYSYGWNENTHKRNEKALMQRLKEKKDVDLILSFGTAAGLDVASDEHNVPTLVLATTDAVDANIVKSRSDSGLDHVYAQVASENLNYNLDIFHDIFKFKKLGVPMPVSEAGRALIGFANIEKSILSEDFDIVPCELSVINNANIQEDFKMCIEKLAKTSDAIFFPVIPGGEHWAKIDEVLAAIVDAGIPSFSQFGNQETKLGVLMSLTRSSFQPEGQAAALALEKIMAGALPRSINQIFESPLGLEINLKMAVLIGWHPPFAVMAAVDKVYQKFYTVEELVLEDRSH